MKSISFFIRRSFSVGGLLALLLGTSLSSTAQVFENATISDNTFVASSFINDNEGWLADNNAMLWHTGNAGQTWDSITIGKYFLKLHFTDALNGFALSEEAAYKTIDGGYTWSSLSLPGSIVKALYFLNNKTGFISGYDQVYKTSDGGITWASILTEEVSFLDYHFTNSSVESQ